ncbi:putative uncharacterized protein CCDC28A-AS1, partial [Plecturocebus cupreus]
MACSCHSHQDEGVNISVAKNSRVDVREGLDHSTRESGQETAGFCLKEQREAEEAVFGEPSYTVDSNGTASTHCNLCLVSLSYSPALTSRVAGITGMHHTS